MATQRSSLLRSSSSGLALTSLFAGAVGIAFAPLLVRWSEVGPSATAFYRILFALPLLWAWVWMEPARTGTVTPPTLPRDYWLLAAAGLLFVGDLAIWHWSLLYTSVANSTLITNCAPIFVTLGAWLLLRERITPFFLAGMALAVGGMVLLVRASLDLSGTHWQGDLLALVAALFYGGYQLLVKHLRRRFSTATIMASAGLVSCPGFFLAGWLAGESLVPTSPAGWMVVAALALVCHVGGQTLIAYAFGHLPASFTSLGLLLQPVVATFLAWLLLSEPISWLQGLGGIITLAGIALARRRGGEPREKRSEEDGREP